MPPNYGWKWAEFLSWYFPRQLSLMKIVVIIITKEVIKWRPADLEVIYVFPNSGP